MIELVIGFVFIYCVRDGAATLLLLKCVKNAVTLMDVIGCFFVHLGIAHLKCYSPSLHRFSYGFLKTQFQ